MIKIINGKMEEELKALEDNSVDSIVTDPPYGISFMNKHWDYAVPSVEQWREAYRVLKPGGYLLSFASTRTQHRMAVNIEDAGFEIRDMIAWVYGSGMPKGSNISKAIDKLKATEAKQWEGWNTNLKPSMEPITMARKPISEKTIAKNVLEYGTGGINIDGCRVEYTADNPPIPQLAQGKTEVNSKKTMYDGQSFNKSKTKAVIGGSLSGRWPANLIHDGSEEVTEMFPETVKQAKCKTDDKSGWQSSYVGGAVVAPVERKLYLDEKDHSAARFFYVAKCNKKDRTEHGKIGNVHSTVKPTDLMKYLVRLVTPVGGTCLDPFMGSGSTGKACILEGFDFIGIELGRDSCRTARKRFYYVEAEKNET